MTLPDEAPVVERAIRTLQVIVGGMSFGAGLFLLVALLTFGSHAQTQLAAGAAAGANVIVTQKTVPVGTRLTINPDEANQEVRTVAAIEPSPEHGARLSVDEALQHDHQQGEPVRRYQPPVGSSVSLLLLVMTVAVLGGWIALPGLMTRSMQRRLAKQRVSDEAVQLALGFQTRTIVAAAMVEGAVFLNIIGYLVTQRLVHVAVAVVLLMLLLAFHWPTSQRVSGWIESQRLAIGQIRELSGA